MKANHLSPTVFSGDYFPIEERKHYLKYNKDMARIDLYVKSLGCKVNQVEMEDVAEKLYRSGVDINEVAEKADLVLINTCSVTQVSDKKSRQLIRRSVTKNPDALVVVTGCYATKEPEIEKIEGVDIVIDNEKKDRLANIIMNVKKLKSENKGNYKLLRSRPYVKISDGCSESCSYCIIPQLRGPQTSISPEAIARKVAELTSLGAKEIVLTGISIGKYGHDTESLLAGLIRYLYKNVSELPRIRLSSIDVLEVSDDLIKLARKEIICKHFHIPLQSGSDRILKAMSRNYSTKYFVERIRKIIDSVPGVCISTDAIAGFPGEDETDFQNTKDALLSAGVHKVHAFKYSIRDGTAAADMKDQLPNSIKSGRVAELNELGKSQYQKFLNSQKNKQFYIVLEDDVILDDKKYRVGLSDNYIKILVEYTGSAKLLNVKTETVSGNYLIAKPIR